MITRNKYAVKFTKTLILHYNTMNIILDLKKVKEAYEKLIKEVEEYIKEKEEEIEKLKATTTTITSTARQTTKSQVKTNMSP